MTLQKVNFYKLNVPYYTIGGYSSTIKLNNNHIDKKEAYVVNSISTINSVIEENKKNIKTIKSLDGVKNVRFLPNVKFNRALFKQMYPGINIRRLDGKADAIIYDSSDILVKNRHQETCYNAQSNLCVDYYLARILSIRQNCALTSIDNIQIDWAAWQKSSYSNMLNIVESHHVDKAMEIFKTDLPYIDVKDVFAGAKTEMRQENLSLEDLKGLYEQVSHRDLSIKRVGADILVSLDTNKYLPLQVLLWGSCGLSMVKSHKTEIFAKYVQDLGIYIPSGTNQSYRATHTFTSSPLYYISQFVRSLEHAAYTESMDYQLLSDLINKILINQIRKTALSGCDNLELDNFQIILKHPKITGVNMSAEANGPSAQQEPNEWIL